MEHFNSFARVLSFSVGNIFLESMSELVLRPEKVFLAKTSGVIDEHNPISIASNSIRQRTLEISVYACKNFRFPSRRTSRYRTTMQFASNAWFTNTWHLCCGNHACALFSPLDSHPSSPHPSYLASQLPAMPSELPPGHLPPTFFLSRAVCHVDSISRHIASP